jgi:integrase
VSPRKGYRKPATSCDGCLAWGVFTGRLCPACRQFARQHTIGGCGACHRRQPLKSGYCRLCWCQARRNIRIATGEPTSAGYVMAPWLRQVGDLQLFFVGMHHHRGASTTQRPRGQGRRGRPRKAPPPLACRPVSRWCQPFLFDSVPRDYHRFTPEAHADPASPWLAWGRYLAHGLAEARGWGRRVRLDVDRALVVLLSAHTEGELIRYSQIIAPLRALDSSIERTAEVLEAISVLVDDRRPSYEDWLDNKLDDFAAGIRREAERWNRTLRDGGPRTRPREQSTVWAYLNAVRPALLEWSTRYDHLREVTRDDVLTHAKTLHGHQRHQTLVALRSLFGWAKKNGIVFRDPTARIKVGSLEYAVLQPLPHQQVNRSVEAVRSPAARLTLALAAVHAARAGAIRALHLDDVDLGNRRLTIAGRTRPIDDLTHQMLLAWLNHRRRRWPNTANPHLLINQMTALEAGPVSGWWIKHELHGQQATLERLRIDRQLEEALVHGPDPLHLAEVFGLDEKTAIRYADSARALLEQAAEADPE